VLVKKAHEKNLKVLHRALALHVSRNYLSLRDRGFFVRSMVLPFFDQWGKTVFWDLRQFGFGQRSFLAIV
jgi:hypothetical protein